MDAPTLESDFPRDGRPEDLARRGQAVPDGRGWTERQLDRVFDVAVGERDARSFERRGNREFAADMLETADRRPQGAPELRASLTMDPDRAGRFDARTWRVGFHAPTIDGRAMDTDDQATVVREVFEAASMATSTRAVARLYAAQHPDMSGRRMARQLDMAPGVAEWAKAHPLDGSDPTIVAHAQEVYESRYGGDRDDRDHILAGYAEAKAETAAAKEALVRHRTGVARANGSVTPEARLDQALEAEAGAYAAYTGLPDIGMAVTQGQSAERRWRAGYRL